MIQSAEFQNEDGVTINSGSRVNVGVLLYPNDLTQEDIGNLESVKVITPDGGSETRISSSIVGYTNGLLTVGIKNNSLPDGESISIRLRLRYEPFPSEVYVPTINTKQIIGGGTG